MWHDQPLEEARGRAECRERDRVLNRYLVKRRDEIKKGKYLSAAQLFEDFIDEGYGKLTENADVVQLFVFDSEANPAGVLRYDDHRARVRRRAVLYEASREILVQNRVHLFGHEKIHATGARDHPGAVEWDQNFEREGGARTKVGR